jgi:hypothetical protein
MKTEDKLIKDMKAEIKAEQLDKIIEKQKELIEHYRIKPSTVNISPSLEWRNWLDKKFELESELASLEKQ